MKSNPFPLPETHTCSFDKRFYVDTLGCPLVRETEQAVFVTVAGMLIALIGADAHTPGRITSIRFASVWIISRSPSTTPASSKRCNGT